MKKYCPSNGDEGMWFTGKFCDHCINQHPDPDNPKQCDILMRSMCYSVNHEKFPEEWQYDEKNNPTCTAWIKWDWGKDDDGNWKEPPIAPPDDPNQLTMPFIFDELEIPKTHESITPHPEKEMV